MSVQTGLFEPINLDGLSIDPMDYIEADRVLERLAVYCATKAQAMRHRAQGNVSVALIFEARLEAQYNALPEWARW